jgi:hypothetical protein
MHTSLWHSVEHPLYNAAQEAPKFHEHLYFST